jgi:hypothetical protein
MRLRTFGSLVVLTACGTSITYVPLNSPPHPLTPRSAESVELFTTAPPARPYVEVAAIESRQQSHSVDGTAVIYKKMREEAARRGCDGLVIVGSNDATQVSGSYTESPGGYGSGSVSSRTLKGYRATCIVYKDATAAPPASSSPSPAPPPVVAPAAPATST